MSTLGPDALDRARLLMMSALDGEVTEAEQAELSALLKDDAALETEWNQLVRLKEATSTMALRQPPEEVWDRYWGGVYRRLERGVGWILLSLGAVVLLSYGLWIFVQDLIQVSELPLFAKIAVLTVIVGLVVLLVSVIREKLFVRRSDPYKDVIR